MSLQEIYNFPNDKFDSEGVNIITGQHFMELIGEFERYFHKKHPLYYANYLFANNSTISLFNQALNMEENQKCGMDLINNEIDLETNFEIEAYSKIQTVYAIDSEIKENIGDFGLTMPAFSVETVPL